MTEMRRRAASRLVRTEPPRTVGETLARAQRQFFHNACREKPERDYENMRKQRHLEDGLKGKDIKYSHQQNLSRKGKIERAKDGKDKKPHITMESEKR